MMHNNDELMTVNSVAPPPAAPSVRAEAARRGAETRRINRVLGATPLGRLLIALRTAQEASQRAKSRAADGLRYREYHDGSEYRWSNYRRSRQARENDYEEKRAAVADAVGMARAAGINFGWRRDGSRIPWVVYFDLPTGQVSFHIEDRGEGPDYDKPWDGVQNASGTRITAAITELVQPRTKAAATIVTTDGKSTSRRIGSSCMIAQNH